MARLQSQYREKIVPELMQKFGYKSVMQVPRITKITLNMGVGEAVNDKKNIDMSVGDLTKIAGQKPVVTKARKAIANFKIRENLAIGTMVTLTSPARILDAFTPLHPNAPYNYSRQVGCIIYGRRTSWASGRRRWTWGPWPRTSRYPPNRERS